MSSDQARYTRNGKCISCGRYTLINPWKTCRECDFASKRTKMPGYLRLPHEVEVY